MTDIRENQRFSRLLRASLVLPSGRGQDLLIQNVSRHGIGARYNGERLRPGESVIIDIPDIGRFGGTVRWQSSGRIGIELADDVDPEEIQFRGNGVVTKYTVADRFKPVATTWRPGFRKK